MATPDSTHARITAAYLRRLKAEPTKEVIKRDTELTGFGVRVKPSGRTSLFMEAKIAGTRKQRRQSVAKDVERSTVTEDEVRAARSEAMRLAAEWRGGNDTVADAPSELPTLQQVLDEYATVRGIKASTLADYQNLLDTHLKPWRDNGIDRITPGAVKELHQTISRKSESRADGAMRVVRALWNFAWADNIVAETGESRLKGKNPVDVLSGRGQWNGSKPKKSHIRKADFKRWHQAVMGLESERCTSRVDVVRDLFMFCVFTGTRLSEALGLTDDVVDVKAKTFTLVNTKNSDDFTLPASAPVLQILKRRAGNGRLFPIEKSSLVRYRQQVTDACGVMFSVHDLRRTFATHARDIGLDKRLVGELLNHRTGRDVTAGYISQSPEPYRVPMQKIARHFQALLR